MPDCVFCKACLGKPAGGLLVELLAALEASNAVCVHGFVRLCRDQMSS